MSNVGRATPEAGPHICKLEGNVERLDSIISLIVLEGAVIDAGLVNGGAAGHQDDSFHADIPFRPVDRNCDKALSTDRYWHWIHHGALPIAG